MTRSREFRGFVVAFFGCMFGVMLCIGGAIEYLLRGPSLGPIFKLCAGIAVLVIVRQCFDFYNFQVLRLMKRYSEIKRRKREKT